MGDRFVALCFLKKRTEIQLLMHHAVFAKGQKCNIKVTKAHIFSIIEALTVLLFGYGTEDYVYGEIEGIFH